MHTEVMDFVKTFATTDPVSVIEIGSRNINGTVRPLFPNAQYVGLDLHAGPDVDVVSNALEWTPDGLVDVVICCEVFEHTADWKEIVKRAAGWLKQNGSLIVTCAGPGRRPHSHHDGKLRLLRGEYYANVDANDLRECLKDSGLMPVACKTAGLDTQAVGIKA